MPKKLLLIFFIFLSVNLFSQESRKSIFGKVTIDSIAIKDVHIFNKTSRKGTISNEYGEFQIPVKENDTLFISDIQYESQQIIIDSNHLNNQKLLIYLKPKLNELKEVIVKEHDLLGNLANDAKNVKIPISKVETGVLDFSKIDFSLPVILDKDEFSRSRTSNDDQLMPPSGSILALLNFVLNPLIKEVSKISQTKRKLKKIEKQYQSDVLEAPDKLRIELRDSFFINILEIQPNQIDAFINYCKGKGLIDAYLSGNKLEIIDILIKESKNYLKESKNED